MVHVLWFLNSKSSTRIGIQRTPTSYLGGSEDAYITGLGIVVRVSSSKWNSFSSPMSDLAHVNIREQAAKGGLLFC
jgi:hypothetical protein